MNKHDRIIVSRKVVRKKHHGHRRRSTGKEEGDFLSWAIYLLSFGAMAYILFTVLNDLFF